MARKGLLFSPSPGLKKTPQARGAFSIPFYGMGMIVAAIVPRTEPRLGFLVVTV